MTSEQAAKLVDRLLAGFPYLSLRDPEGYISALVQVLCEYPAWAGERAIKRVDEKNPDFPPSDRTLRLWLNEEVRPLKFSKEWDVRSDEQLQERKALPPPAERRRTYEEIKADFASVGIFFDQNKRPSQLVTAETVKAKYNITDEQWNAIEDLPESGSDFWAGKRHRSTK